MIVHRSGRTAESAAAVVLVVVTFFWGTTFLIVKDATAQMPVLAFLGVRFAIAALVMIAIRPRAVVRLSPVQRRRGVVVGLVLGGGYVTQTFGLQYTSSSVSGFLTGMFLVFTPIFAWVFGGRRLGAATWLAVGVATAGLALISLEGVGLGLGEVLTLACAALFAGQLLLLEAWSTRSDAYGLAVIQLSAVAVGCLALAPLHGGLVLPPSGSVWAAVLFCAVGATAFAYFGQTWAQSILPASRCAIIMTMEPVFAGITGVAIGGEPMTVRLLAGAACIVAAMLLVELGSRRSADALVAVDH